MIAVSVRKDGITINGHAGYAEAGKDIVCAGVSALTQGLVRSIQSLTGDRISYQVFPGSVTIEYKNLSEKAKLLVDSFFIGILEIAEEYPDYVTIN